MTLTKLGFVLRAVQACGGYYLDELDPVEISSRRMTVSAGSRFEATQALRQVLTRVVVWGMLGVNPAKQGVENPQRRHTEKRPVESWERLDALAARLGPRPGADGALRRRDRHAPGRMARADIADDGRPCALCG